MDMKDLLISGEATPDSLREQFEKQLAEAIMAQKAESEKEVKKVSKKEACYAFAVQIFEYLKAIEAIKNYTKDEVDFIASVLEPMGFFISSEYFVDKGKKSKSRAKSANSADAKLMDAILKMMLS